MDRKFHKINATDKIAGRLATQIASLLIGKHKVTFQPHIDGGDLVEVNNTANIKFTGNKMEDKLYYRHSGYPGGIKKEKLGDLHKKNPEELLRKMVYKMLPKNKLRDRMIKRLTFVKKED